MRKSGLLTSSPEIMNFHSKIHLKKSLIYFYIYYISSLGVISPLNLLQVVSDTLGLTTV